MWPKYQQWFHYCEGMVMPPINTIMLQTILLPEDRRNAEVLEQPRRLLTPAFAPVNDWLEGKEYLIGDFSGADIMLGHSCYMANRRGAVTEEMPHLEA